MALSVLDIRNILKPKYNAVPSDDFRIVDSWAEFDETKKSIEERPLKYLCYKLQVINPENGEKKTVFKALKFCRIIRLPKSAQQSKAFMDMHSQVLSSIYEKNVDFVTVIANIMQPVALGLMFLYGVQGVGSDIEKAKKKADNDFVGLIATLQGTYKVMEMRIIQQQETEWLREKMYGMEHLTVVRGIPKPNKDGVSVSKVSIDNKDVNPEGQGTLEEIILGMADYEYVIEILSTPVYIQTLKAWALQTEQDMSDWNEQLQGQKSLSFNMSIPMMYSANQSATNGWSEAYTDANSVSSNTGESYNMGYSENVGTALSQSYGQAYGQSVGNSYSQSISNSHSFSQGISQGETIGETIGVTHGLTQGSTFGQTIGHTNGISDGFSTGFTNGTSEGNSFGISHGVGSSENLGMNHGISNGISEGVNQGTSVSNSFGQNISHTTSDSVGESQSINNSYSQSQSLSQGQSYGQSLSHSSNVTNSISSGRSQNFGLGESWNTSSGASYGTSVNNGTSMNTSVGRNTGSSWGFSDNYGNSWNNGVSGNISQGMSFGGNENHGTSDSNNMGGSVSPFGIGGNISNGEGTSDSYGNSHSDSLSFSEGMSNSYGGSTSHGFNQGGSYGESTSFGAGTTHSTGYNTGISSSVGHGQSINQSLGYNTSQSQGVSNGVSFGQNASVSQSLSNTEGISTGWGQGISSSHSVGDSFGQSQSQGFTQNYGQSSSVNATTSDGSSYSLGNSTSDSANLGQSTTNSFSNNVGLNHSGSSSDSNSLSASNSLSESISTSNSQSHSQSITQSQTVSNGITEGQSIGKTNSESYTQNVSNGVTESVGSGKNVSSGVSKGTGTSRSLGQSLGTTGAYAASAGGSMGLGPSIGFSKSYAWMDQQVKDILELLEFQNERIKAALRGSGAFYTYVYIACPDMDALSAAKALAKSTWQNEYAMTNPIQVLDLEEEEQQHLLYHFNGFSSDVTRENVGGIYEYKYSTVLLPSEFVAYTHPPRVSEGGIFAEVNDIPKFSVPSMMNGEIYMGTVLSPERFTFENGYRTPYDYRISEEQLMHGYFTGQSRSGKTVAAMRFIAELAKVKRKKTGKRLRIVCMDPKADWRALARFVEPERFKFYSLGNVNFHPIHFNPCKIPYGVYPQIWIDGLIDIYCRAYGLLERGKQMMGETIYALYNEAGVFEACNKENWKDIVPELSAQVTFKKIYKRMLSIKIGLEDGSGGKGKAGNDTRDAYARLLDRLQAFDRDYSIESKLFANEDGMGIDDLIGKDDVVVLESSGLESTFSSFIFGIITSGFYQYAKAQDGGFLAKDQYETVLVIEEANKVLTGSDTAGTGGGSAVGLSGQSQFEEILDQAAGFGLFIIAITQKISQMPSSIIANAGLVFAGRLSTPEDVTVVVRAIGREDRIEDRDTVKWLPRAPTGWFICRSSRTFDFKETEPILVSIAPINLAKISNDELDELLIDNKTVKIISKNKKSA